MTATAKCNITGLALEKLKKMLWGFDCTNGNGVDEAIAENYIEYLNCPDIEQVICKPSDCVNETLDITCAMGIDGIGFNTDYSGVVLTFYVVGLAGGVAPYYYEWTFDHTHFDLAGPINSETLILRIRDGISLSVIVSPVSVVVTDSYECEASISCYMANGAMNCDGSIPCPNPNDLRVVAHDLNCSKVDNLVVT